MVDGCPAWLVEPKTPSPGKPWSWCMEFPDAFTNAVRPRASSQQGFYDVHIGVGNPFGCPAAVKHFNASMMPCRPAGWGRRPC